MSSFIRKLRRETTLDGAALCLARAMGDVLASQPELSPVRLIVHRRAASQGGALQALAHVPFPPTAGATLPAGDRLEPSMSVWRRVTETEAPVLVRRMPRRFLPLDPSAQVEGVPGSSVAERSSGSTHILALPILTSELQGMVTLEVSIPRGDALESWWAVAGSLSDLVDEAAGVLMDVAPTLSARQGPVMGLPVPPSPALAGVLQILERMADRSEPILLTGPTGVGKTWIARACHEFSQRRGRPFVSVNLIALPPDLRLSHLFGWRRGAATGLDRSEPGLVASAEGGTLFLDEIDKLELSDQQALLEFIETRCYRSVGETTLRRANVRVIAASNRNLRKLVAQGRFLDDLHARLDFLPLAIPTLEERRGEIGAWAIYFARQQDNEHGGSTEIAVEAVRLLEGWRWPRNLRALHGVVQRARFLAEVERGADGRIVITAAHVRRAERWGETDESPQGSQLVVEVEEHLLALARAFLHAERTVPSEQFWQLVDGALRAVVTREGLADPPDRLTGPIRAIVEQRNQGKRLEASKALLEQLRAWLAATEAQGRDR